MGDLCMPLLYINAAMFELHSHPLAMSQQLQEGQMYGAWRVYRRYGGMVPVCLWCHLVGICGGGGVIHFCGHGVVERRCYTAWFFIVLVHCAV